jgi:integrase
MRPPKYTRGFVDRHGKPRWYFRREGRKQIALPGLPWSPEFMAAYEEAMDGATNPTPEIGAWRTKPGTFDALIVSFYSSNVFQGWSAETQRTRRNILQRFRADTMPGAKINNGRCRVVHLLPKHVDAMIAAKSKTPFAARNFRKTLRALMQHAILLKLRQDDPTLGTAKFAKIKTSGWRSWGEEQIAAFEAHHAVGTRARLALALLLYTAQRRGDVVRMGRQHVRGDLIDVRQNKTGEVLQIPMHADLQAIIDATPRGNMTFLMTEFGKPFKPAGFGNLFRDWCNEAGLPKGYSAHGLRKAACRRLAEAGCSASQIMALSGHRSLAEAEKYVRAVNQLKMARAAMKQTYSGNGSGSEIGKPDRRVANSEKLS